MDEIELERKWFKLYINWSASHWLEDLEPGPRLCWPLILEYVKCIGTRGQVAVKAKRIASHFDVPEEWITALLEAAVDGDAVKFDGRNLIVNNWKQYQQDNTAAERKQRQRDREKATTKPEMSRSVTNVTRDACDSHNVTAKNEKENEKEKEKERARDKKSGVDPLATLAAKGSLLKPFALPAAPDPEAAERLATIRAQAGRA
jgi:hypothetical protein